MTAENENTNEDSKSKPEAHLGLAGSMAKAFINSPLSPLFLFTSLALGILGLMSTPRQEDPQISVPMVDIFFQYQGASAEQVASLATDPLERLMSEIPGVKHVYSMSKRDGGMVTVQFEVGEAMEPSLIKLWDKLMSNMDKVPPGVSQPMVKPKGVDDVPVVTLTLWSHEVDEAALRLLGLDVMQRLKEVPNTSQSFIVGGRSEAIKVEVYPERLSGFGIGLDQLAQTVTSANAERGVGTAEIGETSFTLYTGSFLRRAKDIERLMVGVHHGSPVYVRDVAVVTEATEDATSVVSYYTGPAYGIPRGEVFVSDDGETDLADEEAHSQRAAEQDLAPVGAPAVTIAVAKKPNTNGVTVASAILEHVERLKGSQIPDNVHVEVTRNYGQTANDKVNNLVFKLFVATGVVTIFIFLALGLRAAIVVLIVIPVVILVTVLAAWLMGYTIDRVSLFALIFSIGILVDDAIVVIENIYRRWLEEGTIDVSVSIDAVREVGNPTILATFTVIAALLPMGFVSGMMGPYMEPIPALGSVAMLFSLFAAFIFTPWLAQRIRPSMAKLHKMEQKEHSQNEKLGKLFSNILNPLLESKVKGWTFAAFLIGALLLSCYMFPTTAVTVKMLPHDNKPEFNVSINMPDGTALPVTANVASRLADELLKIPEVTSVQTYAGTASPFNFNGLVRHTYMRSMPWMGDIQVQLVHKSDRDRTSHQLAGYTRDLLTPIAKEMGAKIEIIEMPPGPPVLQTMVAEIYGPDPETRRQVAKDITRLFEKAESVVDVDNFLQSKYDTWRFVVEREKASRRGVSVEDINRQLEMAMGGFKMGDVKVGHALEPRYIVLQMPMAFRSQFGHLGELPVPSAQGNMIPLGELGRFEAFTIDDPVYHKDLRPLEYVTGEVSGRLGAPIYGILEVEDLLDGYESPDGVRVATEYMGPPASSQASAMEWTGEWTVTYETFRDMGIAFGAAMILIYILVVWEFGNFTLPAIIMVPIPLTLIGIIPGHAIIGAMIGGGEFTATSMIGFIALAGIIVRNSILLVDFSKHAVAGGMDVQDAVISACRTRTRPIIITAFALVGGSFVILDDPIFQGMAISLMAGVLVSTVLTLVVIPLGCVSFRKAMCVPTEEGHIHSPCAAGAHLEGSRDVGIGAQDDDEDEFKTPLWMKIWSGLIMAFYVIRAMAMFVWMGLQSVFGFVRNLFGRGSDVDDLPPPTPPPYTPPTPPTPPVPPKPPVDKAPEPKPEPKAKSEPKSVAAPKPAPKAEVIAPEPAVKEAAKPEPVKPTIIEAEPEAPKAKEAPAGTASDTKVVAAAAMGAATGAAVLAATSDKTPEEEPAAKSAPAAKPAAKKSAVTKAPAAKPAAKKAPAAKPAAKKAPAKKPDAKKAVAKKPAAKKTATAKPAAPKTAKAPAAKPKAATASKAGPKSAAKAATKPASSAASKARKRRGIRLKTSINESSDDQT
ncbi:efflux RND transporter permease subunit [Magnetospira sp. QH-2]|uniref:efflux RND transporter permease subunit n=1 Tax=Magnetospira sp. (strain QH-2) TaxID=1288970 RepID=UPI0003E80AF7|nr:efflux RND transporter permease subunit [Magnetospira sp. QH-2]CCQ75184.1 putative AcrB/AcrD/AcrF family efflux protein [Magnetospira sp. QH-2]